MSSDYETVFHVESGWEFARVKGGGVVVAIHGNPRLTMDAAGWASVVAAMQAGGETTESYYAALSAHTGQALDPATGGEA